METANPTLIEALGPVIVVPIGFVVMLFVLGLIDIAKNGLDPRLVSRSHRDKVGASDAGNTAMTVSIAAAGLFVHWATDGTATELAIGLAQSAAASL